MANESHREAEPNLTGKSGRITNAKRKRPQMSVRSLKRVKASFTECKRRAYVLDVPWAEDNLWRWLQRMELGNQEDYRGSVFHDVPRETVIAGWRPHLGAVDKVLDTETSETLLLLEGEQAEKSAGVQSQFRPWSLDGPEKLELYFHTATPKPENVTAWEETMAWLLAQRARHSISPLSIRTVWEQTTDTPAGAGSREMDESTNSCADTYQRRWKPSPEQAPEARRRSQIAGERILEQALDCWDELKRGRYVDVVSILSQRLALNTNPDKVKRIVWAVWKGIVLVQKTITQELQDTLVGMHFRGDLSCGIALSDQPNIDLALQAALRDCDEFGRAMLCVDYSGFDQHQSPWLMQQVTAIWSEWVQDGEWVKLVGESMYNHHHVITPSGVYDPPGIGRPSGENWTLIGNSFVSACVAMYGEKRGAWAVHNGSFQGDDGLLDGDGVTSAEFAKVAKEFGLEVNEDKSMQMKRRLTFLQKYHVLGYLGGFSMTMRVLGQIMSHERSVDIGKLGSAEIVRAYQQLGNCAFHPLFEEFVEYVASGDKFHLGRSWTQEKLVSLVGDAKTDVVKSMSFNAGDQTRKAIARGSYDDSVARGVLLGEKLPPFGSFARFQRVYGQERIQGNLVSSVKQELARWSS